MLAMALSWLSSNPEALGKALEAFSEKSSLTLSEVRKALDENTQKMISRLDDVMDRLDEERLQHLAGALSALSDATRSKASTALATQALQTFHEIGVLPRDERTGKYSNRKLICVANLGMALSHKLLHDDDAVIVEKVLAAVTVDPATAEAFLGPLITNSLYRRVMPSLFYPRGGSLKDVKTLFPDDRRYFVPPTLPGHHLWVKQNVGPITGATTYSIGLTHHSAQRLVDLMLHGQHHQLPKKGAKLHQMRKCGTFQLVMPNFLDLPEEIIAPLSGTVIDVNAHLIFSINVEALSEDPYTEASRLFAIVPLEGGGLFHRPPNYIEEGQHLISASSYRERLTALPKAGIIGINSLSYATEGGKNGDRDLLLTVEILDDLGDAVADAMTKLRLRFADQQMRLEGKTDGEGKLTFRIENAPSATYTASIEAEDACNRRSLNTPANEFRK